MTDLYVWLKALHVSAALLFIGGLVAESLTVAALATALPAERRRLASALRRWERRVTTPAMLLIWTLGLVLALRGGWFRTGWLPTKLVLVVLLSGLHGILSGSLRRLADGVPVNPPRAAIGLACGAAIAIACLAVAKPF